MRKVAMIEATILKEKAMTNEIVYMAIYVRRQ